MATLTTTQSADAPVEPTLLSMAPLYRLSGISLLAGCALLAVGDIVRVIAGPDPSMNPAAAAMPVQPNPLLAVGWFLQGVGSLFAVLGIPGFYSRAVARTGPVGVAGLAGVTLFLAYFGIFGCMLHALAVPDLIRQGATRPIPVDLGYLASALLVMIGSVALGIGALRARALPRAAASLIIGGGVALFAGHPIAHVEDIGLLLLVVGLGWAGYRLQAEPGTD